MEKTKLYITDKKMFDLIDILKDREIIKHRQAFCDDIKIDKQNIRNIRRQTQHFTIAHIRKAAMVYNVNLNWLFGIEKNVFRR